MSDTDTLYRELAGKEPPKVARPDPEPVEYKGFKVIPGEVEEYKPSGTEKHPLVGESADHYVVLKAGNPQKIWKRNENKSFKVTRKHQPIGDPSRLIGEQQLFGAINKKQKDLIVGSDIEGAVKEHVSRGVHSEEGRIAPFFMENAKGKRIFVKPSDPGIDQQIIGDEETASGFGQAKREVAFHNAMHEVFDLGEHMPTTVAFQPPGSQHLYTAQEYRPGYHLHPDVSKQDGDQEFLHGLHAGGQLPKLAIADWILGNEDRHRGNFLVNREPASIHMIDHGGTFMYGDSEGYHSTPSYVPRALEEGAFDQPKPFDEVTHNWIRGLDHKKLQKVLTDAGATPGHVNAALSRLERLHDAAHSTEKVSYRWLRSPMFRSRQ